MYAPSPSNKRLKEMTAAHCNRMMSRARKTSADWSSAAARLAHSQGLLFMVHLHLRAKQVNFADSTYSIYCEIYNAGAHEETHIHTHKHPHTETHIKHAVVVVDGRPQVVGRQPVSQNEAQSNRSEMNTLEDSQTTTSNTQTHTASERRDTLNPKSFSNVVRGPKPSRKKFRRTAISPDRSAFQFTGKVFVEQHEPCRRREVRFRRLRAGVSPGYCFCLVMFKSLLGLAKSGCFS